MGLKKFNFIKRMHCHSGDFVCGVIGAAAAVRINKMADGEFPR